ncbi:MAG: outer membrane lipoprotein carrier protein LolA [Calditrichaceae bacterium]|nr:outer membrane lipoprotein carrier protein LolA [Calditrichaceae bacterium]
MIKIFTYLILIVLVTFCIIYSQSSQPLPAEEQTQILKTITEKLNTVNNLKAGFKQSRHMEILIDPLVSEGLCYFQKPDKLRWEINQPYQSILIYNANEVAKFDVKDGKSVKLNLGTEDLMREILKQIISWMQGDFSKASEIYDLKIYKSDTYTLVLIPKSKELVKSIQSIEMTFNKNLKSISIVRINETTENFIKIEFSNEQNDISLIEKIFDTQKPHLNLKP